MYMTIISETKMDITSSTLELTAENGQYITLDQYSGIVKRGRIRKPISKKIKRIFTLEILIQQYSYINVVYGPTSQGVNNNNAEQDEFFSDLAHLTSQYMSCALFYIAGDFNSKIGLRKCNEDFMEIQSH